MIRILELRAICNAACVVVACLLIAGAIVVAVLS